MLKRFANFKVVCDSKSIREFEKMFKYLRNKKTKKKEKKEKKN